MHQYHHTVKFCLTVLAVVLYNVQNVQNKAKPKFLLIGTADGNQKEKPISLPHDNSHNGRRQGGCIYECDGWPTSNCKSKTSLGNWGSCIAKFSSNGVQFSNYPECAGIPTGCLPCWQECEEENPSKNENIPEEDNSSGEIKSNGCIYECDGWPTKNCKSKTSLGNWGSCIAKFNSDGFQFSNYPECAGIPTGCLPCWQECEAENSSKQRSTSEEENSPGEIKQNGCIYECDGWPTKHCKTKTSRGNWASCIPKFNSDWVQFSNYPSCAKIPTGCLPCWQECERQP